MRPARSAIFRAMDARHDKRRWRWLALGLVVITFAAYWPVRLNGFVQYDDPDYVTANPVVQQGLTWEGVVWAFRTGHSANWHPLTWLSHMLDCQLFGLNAAGHHFTSLVLHLANASLLFLLLRSLTGTLWRSALVAAFFALHPLRVESVAWVSERKDVLSGLFFLLTLWAYGRYAEVRNPESEIRSAGTAKRLSAEARSSALRPPCSLYYWLALIFFALGLLSKPMLVTLPFLLLLLDYWPLGRIQIHRQFRDELKRLLAEKIPFLILAAFSSGVTLLVQEQAMRYHQELPLAARAANAVVAYARYLGKTVWPQELLSPYPHPASWPGLIIAVSIALLLLISGLAVREVKRRPHLAVGWFWFVGLLVPVIGLVQVGVASMADRYTYLPHIGLLILMVWLGVEWFRAWKWPAALSGTVACLLLLACAIRTWSQVQVWRDTESLFTHATRFSRQNWVAHYNLASLALDRYQTRKRASLENQRLTFEGAPLDPPRGATAQRDYLEEVIFHCRAALEARPGLAEIPVTLAKALIERGQLDEARIHLETVARAAPDNAESRQNLAELFHRQGQAGAAVREYQAALALKPDWEPVLNNLAWLLATDPRAEVRDGAQAVRLAERACSLTGHTNFWLLQTLAAAYAENGQFTNAVQTAHTALNLARQADLRDLVSRGEARLSLYQAGQPLRE
jgi:tetratricopeptide (TPR) repeat protein